MAEISRTCARQIGAVDCLQTGRRKVMVKAPQGQESCMQECRYRVVALQVKVACMPCLISTGYSNYQGESVRGVSEFEFFFFLVCTLTLLLSSSLAKRFFNPCTRDQIQIFLVMLLTYHALESENTLQVPGVRA